MSKKRIHIEKEGDQTFTVESTEGFRFVPEKQPDPIKATAWEGDLFKDFHVSTKEDKMIIDIIERLEKIQKWDLQSGCGWNSGVLERTEDNEFGEWVKKEDIEEIINEFKDEFLKNAE